LALTDPFATRTELKARLGITDTNDDTPLDNALAAATNSIIGYCGRNFNKNGSAIARPYYTRDACLAIVDDISTTTGLVVQTDDGDDGTYETTWTITTDFTLEPLGGVRAGEPGWPYWKIRITGNRYFPTWGYRPNLQVTADFGWPAVPSAVKEACLGLAEENFKMKDAPFGVAGFSDFGAVRVRENPKVAALLQRYMRTAVLMY
jgi:hypothetical protein